jgi:acetate kinase
MTPLEGLVMGTRSGDLDPAVVLYLQREAGLSVDQVDTLLNRQSGLKGLAGSNDLRQLIERGNADDVEALELFCYRIRKYVGAYAVALGRLDALVFTAGIGENSARVRDQVCAGLGIFGIRLDAERNQLRSTLPRTVSAVDSAVPVLVVPTNEELEIARQALAVIRA